VLSFAAGAEAQSCLPVQVRNPDGNYIVPGVRGDIPYTEDLALDAYVQSRGDERASIVVIHGGTWSSGSRVAHVGQILEFLTRAGYNWFSLDYRLSGLAKHEESLADLRAALGFIRCRATELGIDPARLVLLGEDSGAHLAALLAAERPAGVMGAVLVGGFYDLASIPALAGRIDAEAAARASAIARIPRGMPPLLVVHGGGDGEAPIDQARRYCENVVRNDGQCRFVEVAGASHRSENWWPSQWGYKDDVVGWLSTLRGPRGLTGNRALAYEPRPGAIEKDVVYNSTAELKLDAYRPPPSARPAPAVIVVHGGGWEAGDKVTYVTPLFEPLARAGLAWFSIDYRLTPAFPHEDQLEDLRQAIRFVRAQHARFNIDPRRIFLLGESASGQMVALIATEDRSLAGVISFYGVYDFTTMVSDASPRSLLVRLFRRHTLDAGAREVLRRYSPLYRAHDAMPPMLLINGTGERLWTQAQAFARTLTDLGVRHEVIALEGAPHGLENWEGHDEWTGYKSRMLNWIQALAR
jgi:alpha-L-fucosidase 2